MSDDEESFIIVDEDDINNLRPRFGRGLGRGPYAYNEEDLACAREPLSCPHRGGDPTPFAWEKCPTLLMRAIQHHRWVSHQRFLERAARRKERAEMRRMGIRVVGTSAPPDSNLPDGVNDSWWDSLSPYQQEVVVQQRAEARRIRTLRAQAKREVEYRIKHARADVWQRVECSACADIGRVKWVSPHHLERHYTNSRERGGNAVIRKAHEGFPNNLGMRSEKHAPPANYIRGKFSERRRIQQEMVRESTEEDRL
jgi:hypothetical protein